MKQKLIRVNSIDGIEIVGILYMPDYETEKIAIHIHGLSSNFYENEFIDTLALAHTNKGYAFITFNNRGSGYISDFKRGSENVVIGSCFELFEDCTLDISGIVGYVEAEGYKNIILEGHSYGCNKVLYYYNNQKKENIESIILLAPCDMPKEVEKYSEGNYTKYIEISKELINNNLGNELIDFSAFSNKKISAKTFYTDFLYEGKCDFIRYREKDTKSNILNNIKIPVLVVFGDEDECVLTSPKEVVVDYLKNNIENCRISIIKGADHCYTNRCSELKGIIESNF